VRRLIIDKREVVRAELARLLCSSSLHAAVLGAAKPSGDDDDVIILGTPSIAVTGPAQNAIYAAPTAARRLVANAKAPQERSRGSTSMKGRG